MAESKKTLVINVKGQKVLFADDLDKAVESIDKSAAKIVAAMATAGDAIVGLKTTIKNQATEIKSGLDSIASDAAQMAKSVDASVKKASTSRAKAQKTPDAPSQESQPYGHRGTTKYVPRVFTGSSIPVATAQAPPPPPVRHEIRGFELPDGRPPRVQRLGRHQTAASERAIEQIISNIEERDRNIQFKSGVANFGGPDIETLRRPLGRNRQKELQKFQVGDTDVFEALRQETQPPAVVPKKTKAQIADEKFEKEVARARRAWREALNQQNSRYFAQMYQEPVSPPVPAGFGGPDIETLRKPLSSHQASSHPGVMEASGEVGDRMQAHAAFEALKNKKATDAKEEARQEAEYAQLWREGMAEQSKRAYERSDEGKRASAKSKAAHQLATGAGLYGTSRDLMPTELHEAYDEAEKILNARKEQLENVKSSTTASAREKAIANEEVQVVEARLKMNKAQSEGLKKKWSKRIEAEGKLADALLIEERSPSMKNSFAVQAARKEFQQANRDYEAARNPHASDKGVGGQNLTFAAGQLAYGVEDFFQVLAAGQSPMRAFLGAANNIGPALGLLGISATTASMGVAGLLAATALFAHSGARTKREIEDIRKQVDLLSDSMEKVENLRFSMSNAIGEISSGRGGLSRLADDLRAVGNEIRAVNAIIVKGRSLSREAHKNSFPDLEMRARLNPGARRAEEFREFWSERGSEFKTHWAQNFEAFGLVNHRPMERTGDRFQGPRSLSQMKAENPSLQSGGSESRMGAAGGLMGAALGAPGGIVGSVALGTIGYLAGRVVGRGVDMISGNGLPEESAVNRHIEFNLEKNKSERELGVYKDLATLLANLDEQLAKRKAILEAAMSRRNAFMESYKSASGLESEFGVVGLRGNLAAAIPNQRVANRQAIIEAEQKQSMLPEYIKQREAVKAEIAPYLDVQGSTQKLLDSGKFTDRKSAEVAARHDAETNLPRLRGQLEAVEKQIRLIKEAPEAARNVESKQNKDFDEALKTAGVGLLAFDGMMKGVVDAEIIRNEELRLAMRGINQEVAKMNESDQTIIKAAMAFDELERKFNSSVQSSVRSARGGRQENAVFGPDQRTGRELNSEEAIKTLEEERDLAIERARARHANNPQLMNQEIENRRVEFDRKIQAERVRGSGHEFSMITLDKQLADLQRAIEGVTRGVGDPRIVGRMQEQAAQARQGIIESDPLTRLKNDLDGFSMVVATAASETEKLANANKAQNGRLSDLSLAIMDTTSFLKKMGFEVERLPDTLKKMDDRAKAAMKSIDERNLPADVKSRMKEDVRLQIEASKAMAEFSDIANAGSREARGGFAERGVFSTPQGRKTGKMLNFEAAVKTAKEELEVGNKEIMARGGPNAEKAIADRQAGFQRRVAEMMDQAFGITQKKQTKMIQGENLWSTIQESINQDPSIEIEKSQLAVLESIYNTLSGNEKAKPLTAGEQKMANGILAGDVPDAVVAGNAAGGARKPGGFRLTEEQMRNREKERERQKAEQEENAPKMPWQKRQEEERLRKEDLMRIQEEVGPRGSPAIDALKKGGAFGEGVMAIPSGDNVGISLRDGLDQSKLLGDILTTLNTRLENIFGAQMQTVGAINNAEGGLI